jgi:hypothetical protein
MPSRLAISKISRFLVNPHSHGIQNPDGIYLLHSACDRAASAMARVALALNQLLKSLTRSL